MSCICVVVLIATCAVAQIGSSGGSSQGATANQLPLSGKSGQAGSVTAIQTAVPGTTTSINTVNPTVQVQGPFAGATRSTPGMFFSGTLTLAEAIQRGLQYNLGPVGLANAVRQAHGQSRVVRSSLMPNLNGTLAETVEQLDLKAQGLRLSSPIPGFSLPSIVGPFNFFDLRARLTQTVYDRAALNNFRSSAELVRANEFSVRDARDLVVLGVGGAYLQVIAARARVRSAQAQLETADALYKQTSQQRQVGVVAQVDVDRSEVQLLTQKQRLVSLQNDLAKQKINLARMTGLPPTDQYDVAGEIPFSALPTLTLDDALQRAFHQRSDLKAAEAQIRAAQRTLTAARAERLPSASVSGDYGVIGTNPAQSHGTFTLTGTLRIPLWQGGRAEGDAEQAHATLAQREAERDDLKSQIEAEVRSAFLDLQAASSQVEVAQRNIQVATETVELTKQRFQAGVTNNVELVQAQESLAVADLDYINSLFAHNLAKLSLARSMGSAAESLTQFLKMQ
ncbi:MAG TPA: TolC family protein [Candidatus Angelobacter sp.]